MRIQALVRQVGLTGASSYSSSDCTLEGGSSCGLWPQLPCLWAPLCCATCGELSGLLPREGIMVGSAPGAGVGVGCKFPALPPLPTEAAREGIEGMGASVRWMAGIGLPKACKVFMSVMESVHELGVNCGTKQLSPIAASKLILVCLSEHNIHWEVNTNTGVIGSISTSAAMVLSLWGELLMDWGGGRRLLHWRWCRSTQMWPYVAATQRGRIRCCRSLCQRWVPNGHRNKATYSERWMKHSLTRSPHLDSLPTSISSF